MLSSLPLAFWPFTNTGGWEWILILVVAVILFGKRLPEVGRSLGKTLVSFRKGVNEMKDEIARAGEETPPAASADEDPPTPPNPS